MPEQKVKVKILPLKNQRYLLRVVDDNGKERYAEPDEEVEVTSDEANSLIGDGRAKKV